MPLNAIMPTRIRLSGMASGLDTDKIVRDLMRAERIPLDKLIQQKQLMSWKQDDYRSIITLLNDFSKSFLDVSNSVSNMRAQSMYKKFSTSVTNSSGVQVGSVLASGTVNAMEGTHTLIVKSLASAATEVSITPVTAPLQTGDLRGDLVLAGKSISVTIDGVTKTIQFDSDYHISDQASGDAFAADLQALIANAFGKGIDDNFKVTASYDDQTGKITFSAAAGASRLAFNSGRENDGLEILGIANGSSNRLNTNSTLASLQDKFASGLSFYDDNGTQKIKFSINGKEFTFTSDTSLSTVINTINNDPDANVCFSYDTVTDKFIITSKSTGAGQNIKITNIWGNFFGENSATGIDPNADGFGSNGRDAVVVLDGKQIVRSSNTFTEGGVTYTLIKADPTAEITVSLSSNVDEVYNSIKNFIDKYNEVLDAIYSKLNEKYDRDYPPLTDEQRDAMTEDEIEKWEAKAKTGLLASDPVLRRIVDTMRMQMIAPVEGVNITLSSIGISSKSHLDYGKLRIDEEKLKNAIQNNPEGVMNLFSKQSTTLPAYDRKATASERSARFAEEGLAHRLYDIIQDNVSIIMDSGGRKGHLLERAGMTGDSSNYSSFLSKQIQNIEKSIAEWQERLIDKEESYYKKFTAMEVALSKLNSQSAWIQNQMMIMSGTNQ